MASRSFFRRLGRVKGFLSKGKVGEGEVFVAKVELGIVLEVEMFAGPGGKNWVFWK